MAVSYYYVWIGPSIKSALFSFSTIAGVAMVYVSHEDDCHGHHQSPHPSIILGVLFGARYFLEDGILIFC